MTAATKDRDTRELNGKSRAFPVAASAKGYAGTIACVNSSGYAVPGSTSATLVCVGVFDTPFDNTGGANSAFIVEAKRGIYGPFANSASTDAIADTDIGATCYIVDDSTVAKTSNSSARSAAGKVHKVDADGVWVNFSN